LKRKLFFFFSFQILWSGQIFAETSCQAIDFLCTRLNFTDQECSYCQQKDPASSIEYALNQAGFERVRLHTSREGHCYGVSLLFIEYLVTHPPKKEDSCSAILNGFQKENWQKRAHDYSMNQDADYALPPSERPLCLNTSAIEQFFQTLIHVAPNRHLFTLLSDPDPNHYALTQENILRILEQMNDQAIFMAYGQENRANHSVVICTYPEKILIFDSQKGLFAYPDLKTLSFCAEKVWKHGRFHWAVGFSKKS
jgi:hypothetical protein